MMLELQQVGCHNINWVTPEHVVPQILEALPLAVDAGLRLPTVCNTSSYDSPESLELMDGVVDVYMPDFKLWSPKLTRRYLAKRDYAEVARHSVREMQRQVGTSSCRGCSTRPRRSCASSRPSSARARTST
jgi:putative pyruvate formate lyase activating enzyme